MGSQQFSKPKLPVVRLVAALTIATACTGSDELGEPTRHSSPNTAPAAIPVFYDGNGNPNVTYVALNTQLLSTFNGYTIERRYLEEYSWLSSPHVWDHQMTFALPDKPFTGTASAGRDIAYARTALTFAQSIVRNRAGVNLTVPSTQPPITFRPLGPIAGPPRGPAAVIDDRPQPTARDARAAVVSSFAPSPAISSFELEKLRRTFTERRDARGRHVFNRRVGLIEAEIVFDSLLGAVTEERTFENGKLRAETQYQFTNTSGFDVLSRRVTTLFDDNGRVEMASTANYSNLVMK